MRCPICAREVSHEESDDYYVGLDYIRKRFGLTMDDMVEVLFRGNKPDNDEGAK